MSDPLERVASALRAEGGLLADALRPCAPERSDADPQLGELAATGPLAAGSEQAFGTALEAAFEGQLLHHGRSRLLDDGDRDLALLAGDRLYALSLAELAEIGALDAIAELADVIALCAQATAAGDEQLVEAIWDAGATAIGWGAGDCLEAAKQAVRDGDPRAAALLRAAADARRAESPPAGAGVEPPTQASP